MTLLGFSKRLNSQLADLINKFNAIDETDHLQRLFYLQKIDYCLKNYAFNDALMAWVSSDEWKNCLRAYSINEYASFFLKSFQFAQAVAKKAPNTAEFEPANDMYELLQARDELLKNSEYEACKDKYLTLSLQLNRIAEKDEIIGEKINHQLNLLQLAKGKIEAIQGETPEKNNIEVSTIPLGPTGNNANFIITLIDKAAPKDKEKAVELVGRVEDRGQLRLEHELHSFPVAKYFDDFAVFMMKFKIGEDNYDFRPVVLSGKANQGSLDNVARKLQKQGHAKISAVCRYYFKQLVDFQEKLVKAKVFHPDIKLSNFLVHHNIIRIGDRKTFRSEEQPLARNIRSTTAFATEEWRACLNEELNGYAPIADKTRINMHDFMTFQIGMALKQFLILTQIKEASIADMRGWDFVALTRHFNNPSKNILNLCLLAHKLTHPNPKDRLSLPDFKKLLSLIQLPIINFHEKIREILPNSTLNLDFEFQAIKPLLEGESIKGKDLITQANAIFSRLLDKGVDSIELQLMANKLAAKYYQEYSKPYLTKLFATNDWNAAPWYRKAMYCLSFSLWNVDPAQKLEKELFKTLDPKLFSHLYFLTPTEFNLIGSVHMNSLYQAIAETVAPESASAAGGVKKISATIPQGTQKSASQTGKPGNTSVSPSGYDNGETFTSTVFNQGSPSAAPINTQFEGTVANHPPLFMSKQRTVSSVTTTMCQGDGSNRARPPAVDTSKIPRLWEIFNGVQRPKMQSSNEVEVHSAAASKGP